MRKPVTLKMADREPHIGHAGERGELYQLIADYAVRVQRGGEGARAALALLLKANGHDPATWRLTDRNTRETAAAWSVSLLELP